MRGIHIFEKPYYREIRPMRGRPMRGLPVKIRTRLSKLAIGQLIVNILNIILILAACGGNCNDDIQFFKCVSCFAFVLGVSLIGINLGQ